MRHAAFLGIQVSTTKKISKRDGWRDGEDRKNGRWAGQQDKEPAAAAIPAGYSAHGQRITCSGPLQRSQSERGQPQRSIWGHRAGRKGKGRGREKLRAAPQQQRIWSERRRDKQWICYITITTYTNKIITAYMDKNYGIMKGTKYIIAYSSKIATAYRQL